VQAASGSLAPNVTLIDGSGIRSCLPAPRALRLWTCVHHSPQLPRSQCLQCSAQQHMLSLSINRVLGSQACHTHEAQAFSHWQRSICTGGTTSESAQLSDLPTLCPSLFTYEAQVASWHCHAGCSPMVSQTNTCQDNRTPAWACYNRCCDAAARLCYCMSQACWGQHSQVRRPPTFQCCCCLLPRWLECLTVPTPWGIKLRHRVESSTALTGW
jgi:hypothetical protein